MNDSGIVDIGIAIRQRKVSKPSINDNTDRYSLCMNFNRSTEAISVAGITVEDFDIYTAKQTE